MKSFRVTLAAGILAAAMGSIAPAHSQDTSTQAAVANLTGLRDFDFQVGEWRVHHRVKRPADSLQWFEFEGTCSNRSLMDGWANVEDHMFDKPTGITRGVALRAYDPKTGQWAIWWIDGRDPFGVLDPPVKGHFRQRRRHLLFRLHEQRKADARAVHLVAHHAHIRALGTGLFIRCWKDVGTELDHGVPAGLVSLDSPSVRSKRARRRARSIHSKF